MKLLVLPLLLSLAQAQQPAPKSAAELKALIAQQESTRDAKGLLATLALTRSDSVLEKLAVRAIGRLQLAEVSGAVLPLLRARSAGVREEAATALGQMNAEADYASHLQLERSGNVRAALYETIGRVKVPVARAEQLLVQGLTEPNAEARLGAARGLESYVRQNVRTKRPDTETLNAIHTALAANSGTTMREFLLLAMNSARDTATAAYAVAFSDTSALVRRLAVLGTKRWVDDKSPIVRYEALRAANNCERALQLSNDASEMVMLAAIDILGDKKCDSAPLQVFVATGKNWRVESHALVALAKAAPDAARRALPQFASDTSWHKRVYAATAARVLGDSATLSKLARDTQPNVAMEAMTTVADAIYALGANHAGLLMTAANKLKGAPQLPALKSQLNAALNRPGVMSKASSADARIALQARLTEIDDAEVAELTRQNNLVSADATVKPRNTQRLAEISRARELARAAKPPGNIPLEPAAQIARNKGATAQIVMKGLGTITLELLFADATRTVTQFAALADKGAYNGLTFHRIVPNFVHQGGSPGADEYDGQTELYMQDEVGRNSHTRGTLGISTRGYDKGDGQIFINTVDNFRLDRQYTVFARVISGMDVVDRIQEGDIMQSVKIIRRPGM